MAEVFRATRAGAWGVERPCVIKRLRPERAGSPRAVKMFIDEARITAALNHPHIVQLYDFGEIDGVCFLAMEHLDGVDLRDMLENLRETNCPMPIEAAVAMAHQAARALDYAHRLTSADGSPLGIVHRDVSPANIMVLRSGIVKVLDFGVARAARGFRTHETAHVEIKGKPAYMAPEQLQGETVDGRADVYALGAVLWEMLTGRPLFFNRAACLEIAPGAAGQVLPPSVFRPSVPEALDAIVRRSLAGDPDRRFQTAAAMARALERVLREYPCTPDQIIELCEQARPVKSTLEVPAVPPAEPRAAEAAVPKSAPSEALTLAARGWVGAVWEDNVPTSPFPRRWNLSFNRDGRASSNRLKRRRLVVFAAAGLLAVAAALALLAGDGGSTIDGTRGESATASQPPAAAVGPTIVPLVDSRATAGR